MTSQSAYSTHIKSLNAQSLHGLAWKNSFASVRNLDAEVGYHWHYHRTTESMIALITNIRLIRYIVAGMSQLAQALLIPNPAPFALPSN